MLRSAAVSAGVLLGSTQILAAQGLGSITGLVRDSAGAPLAGAQVILDNRTATTTAEGAFRLDSLHLGNHLIAIRLVGYAPLRQPIVVRAGVWHFNYVLRPATQQLPTVYAEARRSGIYGTVGDTSYHPLAGVRVQVAGRGGGEALTDSSGRFAFPAAIRGQYVVRVIHPGYADERLFLELKKDDGVEVAIRLRPSREVPSRADEVAVVDLGRRLVANLPEDRLNPAQLARYESLPLCELPRIAAVVKRGRSDSLTIFLNGTFVLEGRTTRDLCSWRASEVELIEFGDDVCRDVTRTLVASHLDRQQRQDQDPASARTLCGNLGTARTSLTRNSCNTRFVS
jgi:hypothetical protein